MNGWYAGATPTGSARWDGDDGRALSHIDILQIRLDLMDPNKGTAQQRALWQKILTAEETRWGELDALYEASKNG